MLAVNDVFSVVASEHPEAVSIRAGSRVEPGTLTHRGSRGAGAVREYVDAGGRAEPEGAGLAVVDNKTLLGGYRVEVFDSGSNASAGIFRRGVFAESALKMSPAFFRVATLREAFDEVLSAADCGDRVVHFSLCFKFGFGPAGRWLSLPT